MDEINATNETNTTGTVGPQGPPQSIIIANQVIVTATTICMMIGMGATITPREVWENLKKPIGPIIGICCQFLLSPFLGWALAKAFNLEPSVAIGTLAIATCPGGVLSNILTYITDGDTCLSVVMTAVSTVVAFGFMPLWLFVYSRSWVSAGALIPYVEIVIALVLICIPCGIGMLIKWKLPKYAKPTANVCTVLAIIGVLIVLVIVSNLNPLMFTSSYEPYMVALLIPVFAFGFGYIIPLVLRQGHQKSRTIAFETGIQNSALALTVTNIVILRSGGSLQAITLSLVPSLHAVSSALIGIISALSYATYQCVQRKKDKVKPDEEALEERRGEKSSEDGTDNKGFDSNTAVEDGKANEGFDSKPDQEKGDGNQANITDKTSKEDAKPTEDDKEDVKKFF